MKSAPIVIDGKNALLGRLASYVAKQALLGKTVVVLNCAHVVISGNSEFIERHYRQRRARGGSAMKGPDFPRSPERIVKRTIRGMVPHRQGRGEAAFKRVRCYLDVPPMYADTPMIKAGKEKTIQTHTLQEITSRL